jgi:hypothetical protein
MTRSRRCCRGTSGPRFSRVAATTPRRSGWRARQSRSPTHRLARRAGGDVRRPCRGVVSRRPHARSGRGARAGARALRAQRKRRDVRANADATRRVPTRRAVTSVPVVHAKQLRPLSVVAAVLPPVIAGSVDPMEPRLSLMSEQVAIRHRRPRQLVECPAIGPSASRGDAVAVERVFDRTRDPRYRPGNSDGGVGLRRQTLNLLLRHRSPSPGDERCRKGAA